MILNKYLILYEISIHPLEDMLLLRAQACLPTSEPAGVLMELSSTFAHLASHEGHLPKHHVQLNYMSGATESKPAHTLTSARVSGRNINTLEMVCRQRCPQGHFTKGRSGPPQCLRDARASGVKAMNPAAGSGDV